VTSSLVIYVLFLKTFFVIYILMFSVEFLSALVMCFLWASFLDLYCEDGVRVCTVESVVCPLSSFNLANTCSRTMALGSTQPLTEMSTRNLPGGKGWPACNGDNLTAICEPIV
jgi:hypothetical protein